MNSGPSVIALVGSPRRHGNTVFAVGVAVEALEQRGILCETVLLSDVPFSLAEGTTHPGEQEVAAVETLLGKVWNADGLILATPIYFSNVSAQMKAFMDATNDRYLAEDWLRPKTIGLIALGGQGGFAATIDAMRRYLDHVSPAHSSILVATGRADAAGEAQQSEDVRNASRAMAEAMADVLLA